MNNNKNLNQESIIGIIDSGVDRRFIKEHNVNIINAAYFNLNEKDKTIEIIEYDKNDIEKWLNGEIDHISDELSHGTEVLSIIWKNNPKSKFIIAKICNKENYGNSKLLVEALKWMIDETNVKIINISVGTNDLNIKDEMVDITMKALAKGITIFAAAGGIISYPAVLNTVITVSDKGLLKCNPPKEVLETIDIIVDKERIEIWKDGRWVDVEMCTSYACAMTNYNLFISNLNYHNCLLNFYFITPYKAFVFFKNQIIKNVGDVEILSLKLDYIKLLDIIKLKSVRYMSEFSKMNINLSYQYYKLFEKDGYNYTFLNVIPNCYYIVFLVSRFDGKILSKSEMKTISCV